MAKYNKLVGKHVLVIGGTRGIGRGVVEASLEAGARITLVGSSPRSASTAASQLKAAYPDHGDRINSLHCDLSKHTVEQDLDDLLSAATANGSIDHIVFTAADGLTLGTLHDLSLEQMRQAAHMRLYVPTLLGKLASRHLKPPDSDSHSEKSLTLTTGGIADKPAPGWSLIAYFGAGITGLTRNLALDLSPVRVNAVEPGIVNTELWDTTGVSPEQKEAQFRELSSKYPTGRVAAVEDVAEAYVYLMKDRNATGEVVRTRSGEHLI
ncbi:hypothetical protein DL771_001447 [Monosporascus sp. 5C6A]|nr:hypothetical protein DL771_001447 [Monosporascus sp. 5C6A]